MRAAAVWLGVGSLAFYAWWEVKFLPVLCASILFNYGAGILISAHRGTSCGRAALVLAIAANLAALAFYKYADFILDTANRFGASFALLHIALPIGISFFTFTQIAFLVDGARGSGGHGRIERRAF